jgi:long-chain acyl-CoA synthetase
MAEPGTLYEMFRAAVERYDLPVALAGKRTGEWVAISHREMLDRVRRISLGLYDLGVRAGDRVAIISESRPEWTLVDLGTIGCSSALVPVYPTLTDEHIAHIVGDSGAKIVVVSNGEQYEKLLAMLPSLPDVEKVIAIDRDTVDPEANVLSFEELLESGARVEADEPDLADHLASAAKPDDLATLIYTSGTTGKQKGVMLTHRNFTSNITAAFTETELITEGDVAFSFLPLSHIYERTAVYGYIQYGVPVYYATSFDTVAAEIKEVRPTLVTSVPRLFEKMYAKICDLGRSNGLVKRMIFDLALRSGDTWARATHAGKGVNPLAQFEYDLIANRLVFPKWREALGGRLKYFISGGAPLSPDIAYAFLAAGVTILEGYGLTETSPVIAANSPKWHRIGTVGKPLSNVDVKLAEDGEILVKGPSVMQGYFNLPEETAATFTEDGYFKTGDIGEFDADGFLKITDRKKDLIKTSGGKYVAPQPIENLLKSSSLVSQAVVIGDRRKFCSALVVPNFDTLEMVCKHEHIPVTDRESLVRDPRVVKIIESKVVELTGQLSKFETIKKVALLPREMTVESGELTPTLKVRRRIVEERYKDLIDAIYNEAEQKGAPAHA